MLKIMTLNCDHLSNKHGSWLRRQKMIESLIWQAEPDIIALQAVCRNSKGRDQARQIAEATGYGYYFFVPAETDADGTQRGQAMITKYPFTGSYSMEMTLRPGLQDDTQRLILVAEVPTTHGMLRIFNTHFSWIKEQALDNVKETLGLLREYAGMGLLIGDLNADAASGVLEPLKRAGWEDAWEILNKDGKGSSIESNRLFARIDYAFVNPPLKARLRQIEVLNKDTVNQPVRPSDNLSLLVGMQLQVAGSRRSAYLPAGR